jgi:hypothetical protein
MSVPLPAPEGPEMTMSRGIYLSLRRVSPKRASREVPSVDEE